MAIMRVDADLTGGDNDGTTWAKAYEGATGLQSALTAFGTGDIIWAVGDFTLTAPLSLAAVGSATAQGYILGHGRTGGDPAQDGTQVVIDANTEANCLSFATGYHYVQIENIDFTGATGDGIRAASNGATNITLLKCRAYSNGDNGVGGNDSGFRIYYSRYILCEAYSNTGSGIESNLGSLAWGCSAHNNGGHGILLAAYTVAAECVAYENTSRNLYMGAQGSLIAGCTADAGYYGIQGIYHTVIVCCRTTNASIDAMLGNRGGVMLYNVTDEALGTPISNPITSEIGGVETNIVSTVDGYEDAATDKYALRMGAPGFRNVIAVAPNTNMVRSSGLNNSLIVWPGGER